MKTLDQINKLLAEASKQATRELTKKETNNLVRELAKLMNAKMYLETNPSEDFIKSEFEELKKRKEQIDKDFQKWLRFTPQGDRTPTQSKSAYRTEMGYKKVRSQISFMEFILS